MSQSIHLYRDLFRNAARLPVGPVQRKLKYNIRQLFDLYRADQPSGQLAELHRDCEAAIHVIQWFIHLPKVTSSPLIEYLSQTFEGLLVAFIAYRRRHTCQGTRLHASSSAECVAGRF